MKGIQIIGTQRSGSNLLRLMLNQMDQIAAPHPPHIIEKFHPILSHYEPLLDQSNFFRLVSDICQYIKLNPVPWQNFDPEPTLVMNTCNQNTLYEIFRSIYELNARFSGARYWCCKSMVNINFVHQFESVGIKPYYIHLYRDGRDVALSFKKAIVGDKHIYHLAKKWKEEQEMCLMLSKQLGKKRVFTVSYESLLMDPKATLKSLCSFLDIEYSSEMLNFYDSRESENTAESGDMWKNVAKPIITDNYNKYKYGLKQEDIRIFEGVAGKVLTQLGYKVNSPTYANQSIDFTSDELLAFENENNQLKSQIMFHTPKGDLFKRAKQQSFLEELKTAQVQLIHSDF